MGGMGLACLEKAREVTGERVVNNVVVLIMSETKTLLEAWACLSNLFYEPGYLRA